MDFTTNNDKYKSVYSKEGKKIATHKTFTSDIPEAVSAAINKSEYKDWKLEKEKEEIYKDKETDQLKVYKVTMEKGKGNYTLYIQQDGQLLKDIKVA